MLHHVPQLLLKVVSPLNYQPEASARASDTSAWNRPRSRFEFVLKLLTCIWIAFALLIGLNQTAHASGETFSMVANDLQVDVDSRWIGCGQGGYCPVRIRVVNRGPSRVLTFRITKFASAALPLVKQTREVPQNATLAFTLSLPMVNATTNGELRIDEQRGPFDEMKHPLSFPESNQWEQGRPACLLVSPGTVDPQQFEDGISTFRQATGLGAGGGHPYSGYRTQSLLVLPANSLPASWVDFSGLDLISIPIESLSKLDRNTCTALLQWTRCGGTLMVTAVGDGSNGIDSLAKSLLAEKAAAANWSWSDARLDDRQVAAITHVDTSGGSSSTTGPPPQNLPGEWSQASPPFRMNEIGLGKLVVFRDEPFPGTAQDWYWFLKSIGGPSRWDLGKRIGQSSRVGTDDFLLFLIPGIGGVPVVMFLVLITIFSVVIGPLNYFVLAKRKRLHLLILTIPGIALVTSLLLFGYTLVAHGFGVKARSRSLTWVDQTNQSAVTINRLSLYAGQAPSAGMKFSRDTAVFPIWPEHEGFEAGQVDWTDSQVLTSGWLRSRTRTQFLTVAHSAERGRIEVTPQANDRLTVANGFEWGFRQLVVSDEQGRLFVGTDISAGASIDLKPAAPEELKQIAEAFQEYPLELPDGVNGSGPNSFFWNSPQHSRRGMYLPFGVPTTLWHHQESLMEQTRLQLQSVPQWSSAETTSKRTYFGLTTQTPNLVELGVAKAQELASSHIVMGKW